MLEKSQLLMIDFLMIIAIEGIVDNGSYENVCKIVIDQDNKIIDYSCNCYWCDELLVCGHIGAVLLKVRRVIT